MRQWVATSVGLAACLLSLAVTFQATKIAPFGNYAHGCDAFGYLRQAQLFREHGPIGGLDTRLTGPEPRFLIATAQATGLDPARWGEAIAPHCHHYESKTDSVILQYPPGTGLLLALFPADRDAQALHVAASALTVWVFGLAAIARLPSMAGTLSTLLGLVLTVQALTNPVIVLSFSVTASLALVPLASFVALRAFPAGSSPHPLAALALGLLGGLLVLVRIPNVFALAGLAGFIFVQARLWTKAGARRSVLALALGSAGFGLAILPLLLANRINAGSFLATTYGPQDAAPATLSVAVLRANAVFYFAQSPAWTVAAAAVMGLAASVSTAGSSHRRRAVTLGALLSLGLTASYFLTHEIRAPYYLAPGALLCFCLCLFGWARSESSPLPALVSVLLVSGVIGALAVTELLRLPRSTYIHTAPESVVRSNTIVWSDLSSGTLLTYVGKYAAKLTFADACTQDILVNAVADAGRPQYFIDDSPSMTSLVTRLSSLNLVREAGFFQAYAPLKIYEWNREARLIPRC